jgi:DNA polymerase V
LCEGKVQAGFPSPADDYLGKSLSLDEYLIDRPASTFFVRATGDSMNKVGIYEGSLLVVDKGREPTNNKIIIAVINGEFTVKRLKVTGKGPYLISESTNENYGPISLIESESTYIWGVVTSVINKL